MEPAKESYRDQRGLPAFETLAQDARYATRCMRRNRGFTAVAVCSLALGIAGAAAIFRIVNSTLLRPLPYGDPARLVTVSAGGAISAPLYELQPRGALDRTGCDLREHQLEPGGQWRTGTRAGGARIGQSVWCAGRAAAARAVFHR